jgi:hypothetical protein
MKFHFQVVLLLFLLKETIYKLFLFCLKYIVQFLDFQRWKKYLYETHSSFNAKDDADDLEEIHMIKNMDCTQLFKDYTKILLVLTK